MDKMKGKHLIIDLKKCKHMPPYNEVYNLLEYLVKLVHMKKLSGPHIVNGAPYNPGITGFIIIETSHISIHTFEKDNSISMDLYSCKTFNHKNVLKEVMNTFQPKDIIYKIIPR